LSKSIAFTLCETNSSQNFPQENTFFHGNFRRPEEYRHVFSRSTTSDVPIQFFAIASAQGEDALGAVAIQMLFSILSREVEIAADSSVFDFEVFGERFTESANSLICKFILEKKGAPVKVSLSIFVIEGDVLRVYSIGNTRAILVRGGRTIPLSEDQTEAHRCFQMGAISKEEERTHQGKDLLTQYIGRFSQDGEVQPEMKLKMKLQKGDELYLFGTGIFETFSDEERDSVLSAILSPEEKIKRLHQICLERNTPGGITLMSVFIEETFLAAGDFLVREEGLMPYAVASAPGNHQQEEPLPSLMDEEAIKAAYEDPDLIKKRKRKELFKNILIPCGIFLGTIFLGYFIVFLVFSAGGASKNKNQDAILAIVTDETSYAFRPVMYVLADYTELFSDPTPGSAVLLTMNRGDVVSLIETGTTFSHIETADGQVGYALTIMLSSDDPTMHEPMTSRDYDPTPIPAPRPTVATKSSESPETTLPRETTTAAPTATTEETTLTSATTSATSSETASATSSGSATESTAETTAEEASSTTPTTVDTTTEPTSVETTTTLPPAPAENEEDG